MAIFVVAGFLYSAIAWRAPGAGVDPDAWRLVLTGLELWQTGVYIPSRPPGFPVAELLAALTAPLGLLGFKLMTAWAGAACVAFTYLLAARHLGRVALAASMMLLTCPAMVLASTTTMDYAWSLAFMLLGLLLAQRGRPAACGLMIGLAAGCRITALAVLPVAWLLLRREGWRPIRCGLALSASALGVGAMLYGCVVVNDPEVLHESMSSFFLPSFDHLCIMPRALLGRVGATAVAVATLLAVLGVLRSFKGRFMVGPGGLVAAPRPVARPSAAPPSRRREQEHRRDACATRAAEAWGHTPRLVSRERFALGIMAGVFLTAYLAASHEPLYLLPVLPAFFILLAGRLGRPVTVALAAALAFSNYRDITPQWMTYGAVVQDVRDRDRTARLTEWLLHHPPKPPALIIAGSRAPMLTYMAKTEGPALPHGTRVGYLLWADMVENERGPDERLYCLQDMMSACRERGFAPIAAGAEIWWPPSPDDDFAGPFQPLAACAEAAITD